MKKKECIYQYDMNGKLIHTWDSILQLAFKRFNYINILKCCDGELEHVGNFIWSYSKKKINKKEKI